MPSKFQLNKNTALGICDARRCENESEVVYTDGTKLCARHHEMLVPEDGFEVNDAPLAVVSEGNLQAQTAGYTDEIEMLAEQFSSLEVTDQDSADLVGEILVELKNKHEEIEEKRKEATGPLNKSLRTINSWFKPAKDAIEAAQKLLKGKVSCWYEEQERDRRAALASGNIAEAMTKRAPSVSAMTEKKVWTYEVVDIDEVPRELMVLDDALVKSLIKDNDPETLEIAGLRIFQKSQMAMKARR